MARTQFEKLREKLQKRGIKADRPGFLDEPNFLAAEKEDPSFLYNYGRFVAWRPYDPAYLLRAERIVRIAAEGVRASLLEEDKRNSHGKCIHACMALSQILDLHGVWNFVVGGAVCITFPRDSGFEPFRFTLVGTDNRPGKEYGHKWVYAPPFRIVDVTLNLQNYERGFVGMLPDMVMAKELEKAKVEPYDLVCDTILRAAKMRCVKAREVIERLIPSHQMKFIDECVPGAVKEGGVAVKYIPTSTGGSDGTLQQLASYSKVGEKPYEYYLRKIKPLLDMVE